jgi:hypothetical protein
LGNRHGLGDRLDPRVAFGEGFGNALSGMILDDPFYRDSLNNLQSQGFSINVESNNNVNEGWFNEGSVQSILYDIFDGTNDGPDTISAGLEPIYNVLTSDAYINARPATTIFSFLDAIENQPGVNLADINALKAFQDINGTGPLGVGETNDGGVPTSLPVYKVVTPDGTAVTVCSVNDARNPDGATNKLNERDFIYVTIPTERQYQIDMVRKSGAVNVDPDFRIWFDSKAGSIFTNGNDETTDSETLTAVMPARDYFITAFDFNSFETVAGQDSCYDFTIQ